MSDEEYEYEYGSDAEYDYGSDQDNGGEGDGNDVGIEIENSFYEGDDAKNDDPKRAIEMFEKVVQLETEQGDQVKWRFKALQNLVTIYYEQKMYDKMIGRYRAMLEFIAAVTRNECTEAINTILDSLASATDVQVLSEMYEITLVALKTAKNQHLWLNTNLKLAKLYLESNRLAEVERLLTVLKKECQLPDGSDDLSKGTVLLEIYCLEIQLCSLTQDMARMQAIYPKTVNNAAVSDPRIMGIIREEGGKMHMAEGNWMEAYNEFYEAFRSYQEAGNYRAKDCLKYVVLASILSLSDINPFAAREARVFGDDPEIVAMSDLRQSLEANDLARFEKTVSNKKNRIQDEPFIMKYLAPLRRRIREQVLLNLVTPYKRVTLPFLASELRMDENEVESLLVDLIVMRNLNASIDKINGVLILSDSAKSSHRDVDDALLRYAQQLRKLCDEFHTHSL